MKFEDVAEAVRGLPVMTPEQGRIIYDHIRETKPQEALELGTASGVSACYIAAALHENESGHLTTIDRADLAAGWEPPSNEVIDRAGLTDLVTVLRPDDSSYNWFLKDQIAARSDSAGNCEPLYDFCYLDGAHNWTVDGLAVYLIEKLLKPQGWLLLDDLDWTYAEGTVGEHVILSEKERIEPHMTAVFEYIVKQHPPFTELRVQDAAWGWAQKAPGSPRRYSLEMSQSLSALLLARLKRLRRRVRLARENVSRT